MPHASVLPRVEAYLLWQRQVWWWDGFADAFPGEGGEGFVALYKALVRLPQKCCMQLCSPSSRPMNFNWSQHGKGLWDEHNTENLLHERGGKQRQIFPWIASKIKAGAAVSGCFICSSLLSEGQSRSPPSHILATSLVSEECSQELVQLALLLQHGWIWQREQQDCAAEGKASISSFSRSRA